MPPSNVFEINKPSPGGGGGGGGGGGAWLIEDLRYLARDRPGFKILMQLWTDSTCSGRLFHVIFTFTILLR